MQRTMPRKIFISLATILIIVSCFKKSEGLRQSDLSSLVSQFLSMHAQYHKLTDEISERTLYNYITSLDYGKYYFYKEDYDNLQKMNHKIDDYIINNEYIFIYDIFNLYKKRFYENMARFNRLLELNYDFNADETMVVDMEKIDYAKTKEEMDERWRKNIKLQLLNYVSAGKNIHEAKGKLKNKYRILQKRIEEIKDEEILSRFLNAFSNALDPHSNYLTQDEHEDFKISMELKLDGIGVRLKSEDGFVIVESIIPGGAADKLPKELKLKPNDRILSVAQADGEMEDVIDLDLRDVVKKIRGKKGTEVRLSIIREADDSKTQRIVVPIIREEIKLQDSDAESEVYTFQNNPGGLEKIGYIKLPSFYFDPERKKSSSDDLKIQIKKMVAAGVTGIILDVRDNPGGLLNEAVDIAGLFISQGPIVQIKDGTNPPHVLNDNDEAVFYGGPLVILINKFSASASEILAGAIKDYRRGLILGPTNTFGKGTVQSYNPLPFNKGAFKITTHLFYQPSGTSNQLNGIEPDLTIPDITAIWDLGEDKAKYALKWKKITSAQFSLLNNVNPTIIAQLKALSGDRVRNSKEFKDLIEKIQNFKKQMNIKTISLKEESKLEKQKEKELEKTLKKESKSKLIDLDNDLFLKESLSVAYDYFKIETKK